MSVLAVVLIVLLVIVVLLALGGGAATARRAKADHVRIREQIQRADRELAQARSEDKGWERDTMEAAAREAIIARFGSLDITELRLVQVIDLPGTDADQAVFRAQTSDGEHTVTLGRRDGRWVSA